MAVADLGLKPGAGVVMPDREVDGARSDRAPSRFGARAAVSRLSRLIVLASSLLLLGLYVLPLWSVRLKAPQYPEGLRSEERRVGRAREAGAWPEHVQERV